MIFKQIINWNIQVEIDEKLEKARVIGVSAQNFAEACGKRNVQTADRAGLAGAAREAKLNCKTVPH